jgi:beta-mannosidase
VSWAERQPIEDGWQAARCAPDSCPDPRSADRLEWIDARVPGTAAAALMAAGEWAQGDPSDLDAEDWWFRTTLRAAPAAAGEELLLRLDGIATVAEVFLDGERVAASESMFAAHAIDVGERVSEAGVELAIRCRALGPLLGGRRKPRARWRTRLVDGRLRFFRTMLLGRAPGFAPGPAAVGPWRPVWLERRRQIAVERVELRARLEGEDGVLAVRAQLRPLGEAPIAAAAVGLSGPSGEHRGELALSDGHGGVEARGELRVPRVARWWPHTHGDPVLHEVRLELELPSGGVVVEAGRVGFRELAGSAGPEADPAEDGLQLSVNGVPVFARGAVWTPADPVALAATEERLRGQLERVREAGMNILRIPGTSAYESPRFHDLCDELGILVWQDFMFANLDYPVADAGFRALVVAEAEAVLAALAGRPSLAVLCGNSEVEQQVAMMGLDPALGRGELFGGILPDLVERSGADAVYLPSAPCGGELPFRPDRGVANYFGVGGYRRPLTDARLANVRFAAECLAFANVPDEEALAELLPGAPADVVLHHPRWKAGVPRDAGAGWDFDDVRDHYLRLLYGVDPQELRRYDHERYLELSRAVSGEAMAAVFEEWRRRDSSCAGGLVLWLRDLAPGAGWGLLDHRGEPKAAFHGLRRALQPRAVWLTDEGLSGIALHVANDGPEPLEGTIEVGLYRDREQRVAEASEEIELAPHGGMTRDLESILGGFRDVSWAYRFGPPAQDLVVARLQDTNGGLLSQAIHFPTGRPAEAEAAERLGLEARAERAADGAVLVALSSRRLVFGARLEAPGWEAAEQWFPLEPGRERVVRLNPVAAVEPAPAARVSALNMRGHVAVPLAEPPSR